MMKIPGFTLSDAIAPSPWTFPSVSSYLTGLYPHKHGAVAHTDSNSDSFAMPKQTNEGKPLPILFEEHGYETFAGYGFPMPFMATKSWFQSHRVYADANSEKVTDKYQSWRSDRERTFGYIHLGDVHAPIEIPDEYIKQRKVDTSIDQLKSFSKYTNNYNSNDENCRRYRKHRLRLYHAAIDYTLEVVKSLNNELENTTIFIFGDHGEAHWEFSDLDRKFTDSRPNYCCGHGGTPFDVVARVPIGSTDSKLVPTGGRASLIDLPKTIASLIGKGDQYTGCNWKDPISTGRKVLCEGVRYGVERKAIYCDTQKIIVSKQDDVILSSYIKDGKEQFDANEENEELVSALPDDWEDSDPVGQTSKMVESQLRALGYK
ncbi:sulfatase-like hydrolase/transferase [Haladaptatus caseinilyticus]|uniref:sulfatase-like hydrolase/transferase n=1 Tax=Haladaptatus caseinilyticus TaxID=2993314 RepID=UPI00224A5B81|nr:sulfatase-like hydrolase/transferase [Haladaptatus caseinilyticus]